MRKLIGIGLLSVFCMLTLVHTANAWTKQTGPRNFVLFDGEIIEEGHALQGYKLRGKLESYYEGDATTQVATARITFIQPRVPGMRGHRWDRLGLHDRARLHVDGNVLRISWGLAPLSGREDDPEAVNESLTFLSLTVVYPEGTVLNLQDPLPMEYEFAMLSGPGMNLMGKPEEKNPESLKLNILAADRLYE
jgi:hypothetical protein